MVGCYGPRSKNGRRTTTVPAGRSVCTGMPRPSRTGCCSDRCRRLDGQRGSAHGQPGPRLKHPEKKLTDTLKNIYLHCFFFRAAAASSWRRATRASPLRGHHPDARSGRHRRADKADASCEDGRHRWSSRATPLGVVAASTWLPHTVRRPDLALKYHRPCEAHEGSSGHVTMRDRRAYYLSRPPTA